MSSQTLGASVSFQRAQAAVFVVDSTICAIPINGPATNRVSNMSADCDLTLLTIFLFFL